jgi:ferric-dicitrate binding protein FerR (iron transport regulator)
VDERVAAATADWAARFIDNGVDASDHRKVTDSIERWEDRCAAWYEAGAVHEELGNVAQAEGRLRSAGARLAPENGIEGYSCRTHGPRAS